MAVATSAKRWSVAAGSAATAVVEDMFDDGVAGREDPASSEEHPRARTAPTPSTAPTVAARLVVLMPILPPYTRPIRVPRSSRAAGPPFPATPGVGQRGGRRWGRDGARGRRSGEAVRTHHHPRRGGPGGGAGRGRRSDR